MRKPDTDRASVLGVAFDPLTIDAAITRICQLAADTDAPAVYVVKPYVEFLDRASRDPGLARLLNDAELVLADGIAALWAAHFLYAGPRTARRFLASLARIVVRPGTLAWPLPERIAGINFTLPLLETAAARGLRVALVGQADDDSIGRTARHLTGHIPHLTIVMTTSGRDTNCAPGTVGPDWTARLAARLTAARPDLILVGMGFPLQEQIIAELATELSHGVLIGEGGTFDYEAFGGHRPKAPLVMQRLGLEWLWRLILEPARLRRQLAIPRVIWQVWRRR